MVNLKPKSSTLFLLFISMFLLVSCINIPQLSVPVFSQESGTYSEDLSITITAHTYATIYYTINGDTPTYASTEYAEPITVAGDGTSITIKAFAVVRTMLDSEVAEASYTINYAVVSPTPTPTPTPKVDTPTLDRPSGYFLDGSTMTVTIATETASSTIEYTTDGSDPSCGGGTSYPSPKDVIVDETTTIKAIACKDDYDDSDIAEGTYTEYTPDETSADCDLGGLTPVQDAIDAADVGEVIYLPPGTCSENNGQITINKRITLVGAGSGDDPASNTILDSTAPGGLKTIQITTGGLDGDPLAIRNLRVTGSTGNPGNDGAGIEMSTAVGYTEFDNVAIVDNQGYGIEFNLGGGNDTQGITVKNSLFSDNDGSGFRTPSGITNIDGLLIDNCTFTNNAWGGIVLYPLGATTNITVQNSTFNGNANDSSTNGDIVFTGFHGNATFTNVSITGDESEAGIRISGTHDGGSPREGIAAIGNVSFTDLTISGTQDQTTVGNYPSAAIVISRYLGLSNLTFDNVVIDSTAPHGLFFGTITVGGSPDLGDLSLEGTFTDYDIALGKHGNSNSYAAADSDIDATGVNFEGATIDDDIETRIWHSVDDGTLGTVTWTTP